MTSWRVGKRPNLFGLIGRERHYLDPDKIVGQAALRAERVAKRRAPWKTGRLRTSITAQPLKPGVWVVKTNVTYASYVEFGTRYMAAQPFMRPALGEARQTLNQARQWRK